MPKKAAKKATKKVAKKATKKVAKKATKTAAKKATKTAKKPAVKAAKRVAPRKSLTRKEAIEKALTKKPKKGVKRRRTTKVKEAEKALEKAIEGDDVDDLVKALSPSEQELFYEILATLRGDGSISMDDLWTIDYVKRPPTMGEYIKDDYWMGRALAPSDENEGLWPTWVEVLERDFDLDSRVNNAVITGSLGIGKTYIMMAVFSYKIAVARLLRNPQNFFGLSRGTKIFYSVLSLTKSVVSETAFGDLQNFMSLSPFFLEECHYNPDLKYANFRIPLGNDIILNAGSKGHHVIGRNVMGACMDEGNWRLEKNPDMSAYELYDEVRTRIKNRFQKISGFLPAISILASSAKDESSFTEKVIKDINGGDPRTGKVYRYPVYYVKRHALTLSSNYFKVAHGLRNMEPHILAGWYDKEGNPLPVYKGEKCIHEEAPSGASTELVPEDYYDEYKRRTKTALQSLSGISTGADFKLFSTMVDVERSIDASTASGLENPCLVTQIPLSEENNYELWDFVDHKAFLTKSFSRVVPKRNPHALRFAHLDLATRSLAGLAICHVVGTQKVDGLIKGGRPFSEYRLVIEYDFILTITAGQVKPISLEKVQKFFFWLRDMCGFRFGIITADQYQSDAPLQMLESRGFKVGKLSLDRNKTPYYAYRSGFEEGRIRTFRQLQLMRELEELIDGDKVDHPPNGTKDTADAAAGAYFDAVSSTTGKSGTVGGVTGSAQGEDSMPFVSRDGDDQKPPIEPVKHKQASEPVVFDA